MRATCVRARCVRARSVDLCFTAANPVLFDAWLPDASVNICIMEPKDKWQAIKRCMAHLLGVIRIADCICEPVVYCSEPCAVRIANPGHLNRCSTHGTHTQTIVSRMTYIIVHGKAAYMNGLAEQL